MALELSVPDFAYSRGGESGVRWSLKASCFQLPMGLNALVGVNGAGKSTLLKLLAGVICADVGILAGGVDLGTQAGRARQTGLGYLPQDNGLAGRMTPRQAIEYAAWLKGLTRDALKTHVDWALEITDTARWASLQCRKLSGGTARRVALACALVHRPVLLLLDEPTAGLDPLQRDEFYKVMRSDNLAPHIFIATHLIEDVTNLAQEMLVLDGGKMRVHATVSDVAGPDLSPALLTDFLRRELSS